MELTRGGRGAHTVKCIIHMEECTHKRKTEIQRRDIQREVYTEGRYIRKDALFNDEIATQHRKHIQDQANVRAEQGLGEL